MAIEAQQLARAPDPGAPITALNALAGDALTAQAQLACEAFRACRAHSLSLAAPLTEADMMIQSMPDASPTKWHLAHTSWFFETFILEPNEPGFRWFDEGYCVLFNSYYNGIGEQFPRPRRGMISRPGLAQVLQYRADVEARVLALVEVLAGSDRLGPVLELLRLGINHEQQHQELLLTDIKHGLSQNPAWPAYSASDAGPSEYPSDKPAPAYQWQTIKGGRHAIGYDGAGFCFDNETPRHELLLNAFAIADRPVSNGEWREFIADGGYDDPLLWLSEGWAWRQETAACHPLYWRGGEADWEQFTLRGAAPINDAMPVAHVCYYEADAFARWAGYRLPTEAEWEVSRGAHTAAPTDDPADNLVDNLVDNPVDNEFSQLWAWTGSAYLPYPGFDAAPGAVGEYNGKFMINQMVLRGASSATPAGHGRQSYRNFFPAHARWQYSGVLLAKDAA